MRWMKPEPIILSEVSQKEKPRYSILTHIYGILKDGNDDPRRRQWQPTPVFLPGESQGWDSLMGCHLWGHTELDMTEAT